MTDVMAIWAESYTNPATYGELTAVMGATQTESGLPWPNHPEDLSHFRDHTAGRILVMGRTTFDKLPASMKTVEATYHSPLIVLTHSIPFAPEPDIAGYWHAGTFESPQDLLRFTRAVYPDRNIAIIGGASVIEWAEPIIDYAVVTMIPGPCPAGDVRAPSNEFLAQFPVEHTYPIRPDTLVTSYRRSTA